VTLSANSASLLQEIEGFLDDDELSDEDDGGSEDEDAGDVVPLSDDSMLDFMPDVDGRYAPTVREPWRSGELHRLRLGSHIQECSCPRARRWTA
jgi:hypothetical protein